MLCSVHPFKQLPTNCDSILTYQGCFSKSCGYYAISPIKETEDVECHTKMQTFICSVLSYHVYANMYGNIHDI